MTNKELGKIIEKQNRKIEKEVERQEREERRERLANTALLVGGIAAGIAGGKYLQKNGAIKKIFESKTFGSVNKNMEAMSDFAKGMGAAIKKTTDSKGMDIFTKNNTKAFSNNIKKYLQGYSEEGVKLGGLKNDNITKLFQGRKEVLDEFVQKRNIAAQKNIINEAIDNIALKMAKEASSDAKIEKIQWTAKQIRDQLDDLDKILAGPNKRTASAGSSNPVMSALRNNLNNSFSKEFEAELRDKNALNTYEKMKEDILEAIGDKISVDGGGSFRDEFFRKTLVNDEKLQKTWGALRESTLKDIVSSSKNENTKTGKFLQDSGLNSLTVEDAVKKRLFVEETGSKFNKHFNIYDELKEAKGLLSEEEYKELLSSSVDSAIFKGKFGEVIDLRHIGSTKDSVIKGLADNIQVPFVGIKPFKMLELLNQTGARYAEKGAFFAKGTVMDTILGTGEKLDDDFYVLGDVLKRITKDGEIETVREGVTLINNNPYDTVANQVRRMTGRAGRDRKGSVFSDITDIGKQDTSSVFDKFIYKQNQKNDPNSFFSRLDEVKKFNKPWEELTDDERKRVYELAKESQTRIQRQTTVLQKDVFEIFNPRNINKDLDGKETTASNIYETIMNSTTAEEAINSYIKNNSGSHLASVISGYGSKKEAYKKLQETYLKEVGYNNVDDIALRAFKSDKITEKEFKQIQAYTSSEYLKSIFQGDRVLKEDGKNVYEAIIGDTALGERISGIAKKTLDLNKEHGPYMGTNPFEGNSKIVINKNFGTLEKINEILKSGGSIEDVFNTFEERAIHQMGFGFKGDRAGAGNMDKVSKNTIAPFFFGSRLSDGVSGVGLGLGPESMTSTQDLYKNLWLKRVLLPIAAIQTVRYLNDEAGNIFGEEPSDAMASTYASMTIDVQRAKDALGINELTNKWGDVLTGSEHLFESPIGAAIKYGTFGLIGDDRGAEELKYFYEKGRAPVRKSRGWGIGSSSPIYGTKVERYDPSWYRKVIGEPNMTDSQWGSEEEYWANNWLPNPRNPLGPLKKIVDPYHWENKHKKDRPWAVSGRIQELNSIPLVGPLLDSTVGRVIKPTRVHSKFKSSYEEMIEEINSTIVDAYQAEMSPGAAYFSGTSQRIQDLGSLYTSLPKAVPSQEKGFSLFGKSSGPAKGWTYPSGEVGGGQYGSPVKKKGLFGLMVDAETTSGYVGSSDTEQKLNYINSQIASLAVNRTRSSRSTDIARIRDDEYVSNLSNIENPRSLSMGLSDAYYSAVELGGIYGFYTQLAFGEMEPDKMLQDSTWALSGNKAFWDLGIGGTGGDISEIYRRFLPNSRKIDTYNPIRNTMPDWMPSYKDYFKDFQHGDPMSDLPGGVYRLPGAGYESINKLNSDPYFGRYGALDRMKILGDVAPWSQQFTYYSKVTTVLHDAGVYTDEQYEEAQRVRDEVKAVKKKYEFADYKFLNQYIEEDTVTIDTVLDDWSFTTKQDPGEVYKLAGIKLPSKDDKNRQAVEEYLSKVLYGGNRIKIKKSSDPLNYNGSDIKESVKVSVYDGGNNVQQVLMEKYGVKSKNDGSAAANDALYTGLQKGIGGLWEKATHHDNVLNNVFMRNRTPLEEYERSIVYGKSFRTWNHPIEDWVKPTINRLGAQSPISAGIAGGIIGGLSGIFLGKGASKSGAIIGAAIGSSISSVQKIKQGARRYFDDDYISIPKETKKRRELNEYFDKLKYIKYKGLYEKAKSLAKQYDHVDVDKLTNEAGERPYIDKKLRRKLDGVKKWLQISAADGNNTDKEEAKEKIAKINDFINGKDTNNVTQAIGTYTRLALKFKDEYESTLYGADPNGDVTKILNALPKEDRPFFQEFLAANPKDRQKILRLVPKNQRKFYEAKWGIKSKKENKESLIKYFMEHKLPGENWKGWKAGVDLDEIKVKMIDNMGENVSDYGYYKNDLKNARSAPKINKNYKDNYSLNLIGLRKVLKDAGLKDVEVFSIGSFIDCPLDKMKIDLDIKQNRDKDLEDLMYQEMPSYI